MKYIHCTVHKSVKMYRNAHLSQEREVDLSAKLRLAETGTGRIESEVWKTLQHKRASVPAAHVHGTYAEYRSAHLVSLGHLPVQDCCGQLGIGVTRWHVSHHRRRPSNLKRKYQIGTFDAPNFDSNPYLVNRLWCREVKCSL